jgi:hypothetical protein
MHAATKELDGRDQVPIEVAAARMADYSEMLAELSFCSMWKPSKGTRKWQLNHRSVLVHGFWGGAAHWAKVIIQLSKMGHD